MKAGIYVHIPFCVKKCHYCSFNSIPYEKSRAEEYQKALLKEINSCREDIEPVSLYVGGGTPTVLPEEGLFAVLKGLKGRFSLRPGTETTVEANPGTLTGLDLAGLRDLGVNRVSLGAQSFRLAELKMLGRLHGPEEVGRSVRKLREAGFVNIGLDLMYSLPGQDLKAWKESIACATRLGPEHISIYDLTLEEDALLYGEIKAGRLSMPPEAMQVEMYLAALEELEKAGFVRYEISNFAMPGYECRHNLNYWSCGDYIGFGAGAHSHLTGARYENMGDIGGYVRAVDSGASPVSRRETLSPVEKEREHIMLGFRKAEGISLGEFGRLHGHGLMESYGDRVKALEKAGYLDVTEGSVSLTVKGVLAANYVIREFF